MVKRLEAVLAAADAVLYKHLTQVLNVEIPLFAFRWVNCLLLRELTITQSLRLFDTYLSDESRDWSSSHVFVCCALLLRMSSLLMNLTDFAVALHTLQNPPTERLSAKDMNEIISGGLHLAVPVRKRASSGESRGSGGGQRSRWFAG
ncbi:uncharacterized protein LOC126766667 [Bactrocera neohumeralis]|uniref:uncharacterized protein LOC126766667 n=1 Tax=Bactrocera neohumeralis TaxID=98809 RepID=UPI0021654CAF|nr:uncharacterized protein LOC126766667 [Bactrocera neohumeralis]